MLKNKKSIRSVYATQMVKHNYMLKLIPFILFLGACGQSAKQDHYSATTYQEQKLTLEQQEKQAPLQFISSDGTYRKNLFGRFVLDGTITNTATIATYKDIVLEIRFYSRTETLLGTKQYTLYQYYPPGSKKTFQLKVDANSAATKIGWKIVKAGNN